MNADIYETIHAMHAHGGLFVQALADAWEVADVINRKTIERAFSEAFVTYRRIANEAQRCHSETSV